MKYKIKTRLFAALALSGVSFYWPTSRAVAQEDDFGFIRPAEPTRQDDQELEAPPIAQASPRTAQPASVSELLQPSIAVRPPAAMPPVGQSPQSRRGPASAAPVPFASSNVFNGAYVTAGDTGARQSDQSTSHELQQSTVQQVAYQQPLLVSEVPPILSGVQAERNYPPIVQSGGRSSQQNELPPILHPTRAASDSALPPIVPPNAGLGRLLAPIQTNGRNGALLTADESSIHEASSVQPAGFGGSPKTAFARPSVWSTKSPVLMQDAPPIVGSVVEGGITGGLPPSLNGSLVPVEPTINLQSGGSSSRAFPDVQSGGSSSRAFPDAQSGGSSSRATAPGVQDGGGHGSGVSGCTSCGENGCFDPEQVENLFNTSGANAYARRYAIAEVLYFDRTEGQITNSNFGSLNNFDPGVGARITVGTRTDSTRGREFQYSGIDAAEQTLQVFQPTGLAQSQFVPTGGLTGGNLQAFFNATEQSQSAETYFHSLEFNRVKWGWDVIKSYVGLRYIYVDDEYTLFSQSASLVDTTTGAIAVPAESGFFQLAASNHLIGPHIGGELYYDVGYRWSLQGVSRLGAYLNVNSFDTHLVNDGVEFIDAEDTNTTVSFTYEIGLTAKYRLTRQAQFRIGYNILFFDNLATASDNLLNVPAAGGIPVSPTLGSTTTDEESVLFHGLSIGFELYR